MLFTQVGGVVQPLELLELEEDPLEEEEEELEEAHKLLPMQVPSQTVIWKQESRAQTPALHWEGSFREEQSLLVVQPEEELEEEELDEDPLEEELLELEDDPLEDEEELEEEVDWQLPTPPLKLIPLLQPGSLNKQEGVPLEQT